MRRQSLYLLLAACIALFTSGAVFFASQHFSLLHNEFEAGRFRNSTDWSLALHPEADIDQWIIDPVNAAVRQGSTYAEPTPYSQIELVLTDELQPMQLAWGGEDGSITYASFSEQNIAEGKTRVLFHLDSAVLAQFQKTPEEVALIAEYAVLAALLAEYSEDYSVFAQQIMKPVYDQARPGLFVMR